MRLLTKSRIKLGLECPKKLFYYGKSEYESKKNHNEFLEALAEGGYQVGELAKFHYKYKFLDYHFADITSLDYNESLQHTAEALKHEKVVICEGAFLVHNFFIRADIIVKNGDSIKLIEVKSKSTKSGDEYEFLTKKTPYSILSDERPYLADIAFQQYVMNELFPDYNITPYLMLVNKLIPSNIDGLNQLFKIVTIEVDGKPRMVVESDIDRINSLQEEIKDTVLQEINVSKTVNAILNDDDLGTEPFFDDLNRPLAKFNTNNTANFKEAAHHLADLYKNDIPFASQGEYVGAQCSKCEYRSKDIDKSGYYQCWKERFDNFNSNQDHIHDVWYFPTKKTQDLLNHQIWSMEQLHAHPEHNPIKVNENPLSRGFRQYLQIEKSALNDTEEWISEDLKDIMGEWQFPFHFIDFETCTVALPFHKGEHPYSMIGSQFSVHTLHEDGTIKHFEWLAETSSIDPSIQFVAALKDIIGNDNGSIFRYAAHENTTLKKIAERIPLVHRNMYQDEIDFIKSITIIDKKNPPPRAMIDLKSLVEKHYYNPITKGSNSLKDVLPAIMHSSPVLAEKYSKPLEVGINLKDFILYEKNNDIVEDPYRLLPSLKDIVGSALQEFIFKKDTLKDGGAAMKAFQVLQFSDISEKEEVALRKALLNYCELDTMAMVMLYEHLNYLISKN